MPSFSWLKRTQDPRVAVAPQQPDHPAPLPAGQVQASLAGPPGLARRENSIGHGSRPPRRSSPHANGLTSTPAEGQAAPASGCRLPSLSLPGAKSYPIALNAQIAGFALVNVSRSGPARPTTPDAMPKPGAHSLRVTIPATAPERVELARQQAAQATRAAAAAAQPEEAPAVRKKKEKGLLRRAKRLLSKAETKIRTQVLGLGMPSAPTVKDVLQVGRLRQDGPPPPASVKQALQIRQQHAVVEGVRTTYHARAGRAALAAVESLHAHEEQVSEHLVGDYVDRFAQLHGACHDAAEVLEAALDRMETHQAALDLAHQLMAEAAGVREELAASLPQLEAAHRRGEDELQRARETLHATGTVPGLEQERAQARDTHGHLQRWAEEIAERRGEMRAQAGPRSRLLDQEAATCSRQLEASDDRLARFEAELARARWAQSEVARLEQCAGEAAGKLAQAGQDMTHLDKHCQGLKESLRLCKDSFEEAQSSHDAARRQFEAAENALRQHQQALRGVEARIRPALDIERSLATAREAQARLDGTLLGVEKHQETLEGAVSKAARQSMQSMRMAPPGFAAPDAALRDALGALEERLLALPPKKANLAADEIFELAIRSAARVSGHDPAVAAQALQALGLRTLADLAGAGVPPQAAVLAQEVSRLPRGMEILGALVQPSQPPLAPDRVRAVQTYLAAGAELARVEPSDQAARQWLAAAQAGAAQIVQGTPASDVPHRQRVACHGVRNGFMTDAPGSDYEKADRFMRSISDEMLNRALAARPEPGPWGRVKTAAAHLLPIHKPTPFNTAALQAASRTAVAVGIVVPPQEALDRLFAAFGPLRTPSGSSAGRPKAEQALLAFAEALQAHAAMQPPASLALDDGLIQAADIRLGEAGPPVQEAWAHIKAAQPRPHPLEALRTLLDLATREAAQADAPNPALAGLGRALDLARGSFFMANPRIETTQDIVAYCKAIIPNLKLRDKLKITGGRVLGVTTAGLTVSHAMPHGVGPMGRLDLRKSRQDDQVVDLVMGTQAIQLTIGTQATAVDRAGVGGGAGVKLPFGVLTIRPVDLDWKDTGEVQSQEGVLLRVPRDKKTERTDLAQFQAMVADVVKWRDVTLPDGGSPAGPLEAVLSLHPAASVNLLAEYDRQARKRDSALGAVLSVGIPGARITATGSVGGKNQVMATRAKEATGHFQFQERKKNVVAATQAGFGVGLSIPLLSAIAGNTGLTANGARLAESADVRTRGVEKTVRLTTEDNVIAPLKSRLITEYLRADDFEKEIRRDWKNWVTHGVAYTTSYPADWSDAMKHVAAERELVNFLAEVKAKQNEFMAFSLVTAMRPEVAPRVDALRGLIEAARQSGDAAEAELAKQEHRLDELLAEPSTWMVRRLVVNERANRTEQQGLSLLAVAQVSSVADASHNALLYPRG